MECWHIFRVKYVQKLHYIVGRIAFKTTKPVTGYVACPLVSMKNCASKMMTLV